MNGSYANGKLATRPIQLSKAQPTGKKQTKSIKKSSKKKKK